MLKLLSLNCWGGNCWKETLSWLDAHRDYDVVILQEVLDSEELVALPNFQSAVTTMRSDVCQLFVDHTSRWTVFSEWTNHETGVPVAFGLLTLIRKGVEVERLDDHIIDIEKGVTFFDRVATPDMHWRLQVVHLRRLEDGKSFCVMNVHGIPTPGSKLDSVERLRQSEVILDQVKELSKKPVVVMGDFNLLPHTQSIGNLSKHLTNLIAKYQIESTRSKLNVYWGTPQEQKHADYTFVSTDIEVISFDVPDVAISDHLPMRLTIRL